MSNEIRSNIKIIANLLKDEKILTVEEMLEEVSKGINSNTTGICERRQTHQWK